jgi:hypothetical protein
LPRGKERTKKTRQRLPPLETALSAVLTKNGGKTTFCKTPPSWAHKRTPKMGWQGKSFCRIVLLEIQAK